MFYKKFFFFYYYIYVCMCAYVAGRGVRRVGGCLCESVHVSISLCMHVCLVCGFYSILLFSLHLSCASFFLHFSKTIRVIHHYYLPKTLSKKEESLLGSFLGMSPEGPLKVLTSATYTGPSGHQYKN